MSDPIRMTAHAIGAAVDFNEIDPEDVFIDSPSYDALAADLARCRAANAYDAEALRQLELARERIQHLNAGIYIVHTMRLNWGLACPCKCSECDILFEGIRDHLPEGSEQETSGVKP